MSPPGVLRRPSDERHAEPRPRFADAEARAGYHHEAMLYADDEEFMAGTLPFMAGAIAAREPILAVLAQPKITALRAALGEDARRVHFADMATIGANPGRLIAAWQDFVAACARPGTRVWGVDEPAWPGRGASELEECARHEELINLVFPDADFTLLCPYDTSALDPALIASVCASHPFVSEAGGAARESAYAGAQALAGHDGHPLPPPAAASELRFGPGDLQPARAWVGEHAAQLGLRAGRLADLLLAFSEVATNSVLHGGGTGTIALWRERDTVLCEVRDGGHVTDPLAGRTRPSTGAPGGRGLWIANQVADLVQLRSRAGATVVRIHVALP